MLKSDKAKSHSLHFFGAILTRQNNLLTQTQPFIEHVKKILDFESVVCLGSCEFSFSSSTEQSGFTAVLMLAESHIAIHTWPEYGVAELDVYLCNYLRDNRQKCERIFDETARYFEPHNVQKNSIERVRADSLVENGESS